MKSLSATVLCAATLAGALVLAQDQPPQPTFRTEANYVRVDVYPTRRCAGHRPSRRKTSKSSRTGAQKVEQFERILIRRGDRSEGRREPNTVEESRRAIQDPRARVFVLFLDNSTSRAMPRGPSRDRS